VKKYRNRFCNINQKYIKTEKTLGKKEWFCEDEPIYLYIEVGDNNNKNKIEVGWHQCMTFI
jgi:hypothetical protein